MPTDDHLSIRELAHELNSQLDGVLRLLRLAERESQNWQSGKGSNPTELPRCVSLARTGLERLAGTLEMAMVNASDVHQLCASNRSLGDEARWIVDTMQQDALLLGVSIDLELEDRPSELPAGPLASFMRNAMQNALRACEGISDARITLSIAAIDDSCQDVAIAVSDTGPGFPSRSWNATHTPDHHRQPGSHGIGLPMCRRLVESAGGCLEIVEPPFACGAIVRVTIPASRLDTFSGAAAA